MGMNKTKILIFEEEMVKRKRCENNNQSILFDDALIYFAAFLRRDSNRSQIFSIVYSLLCVNARAFVHKKRWYDFGRAFV